MLISSPVVNLINTTRLRAFLLSTAAFFLCLTTVFGQVTTASIAGQILDAESSQPLVGATIQATHQPTGTQYGGVTREEGRFTIPNMRVGGPYLVTITYVGYKTETIENVSLVLGQRFPLTVSLRGESSTLQTVTVRAASGDVMSSNRTGASTNISSEQLRTLPTIKRSVFDYTRLTPMSGGATAGLTTSP